MPSRPDHADATVMRRGLLFATAALTPALLLAPTDGTASAAARRGPPVSSAAVAAQAWLTQSAAFVPGTSCPVFPADNVWHADVSRLKVSPYSAQWLSHMGATTRKLHADFGPSFGAQPVPYGIPVTIVNGAPRVPVTFDYADESDPGPYPLSTSTKIEGGSTASGDRHAIVVDAATCTLFETYDTRLTNGKWTAGSGAIWSLRSDALRPYGWTSADAAGLAILPGLLTYDEVARGVVNHAIRFTTNVTDTTFVWPARHSAGSVSNRAYPPMGARFRLKASFSIAGYSREAQIVLTAMKKYGLILADNGSPWYFQGTSDTRWTDAIVSQLGKVPASAFEAVDTAPLIISNSSGAARPA
jgi:hypothetical protein